jgi:hypothetical protein
MTTFRLEQFAIQLDRDQRVQFVRSAEVQPEHITECRRLAYLFPPPDPTPEMPGGLAVLRGELIDYILVKSRYENETQWLHYVLIPPVVMEAIHGNMAIFEAFGYAPIPTESSIPRYIVEVDHYPDHEAQIALVETLLNDCRHDLKVVGRLLSTLIEEISLNIINAPPILHMQMEFIQALLLLVPPPFRSAFTFAVGVCAPEHIGGRIKFLQAPAEAYNGVVYDWKAGRFLQKVEETPFSRFITAQISLDPRYALDWLEDFALWPANTDDMSDTLTRLSRRASLDAALKNGFAVNDERVAEALLKDDLLNSNLSVVYGNYLLSLAFATREPERADAVFKRAARNDKFAGAVQKRIESAVADSYLAGAYRLLYRWITELAQNESERAPWMALLARTVEQYNRQIALHNVNEVPTFIDDLMNLERLPRATVEAIIDHDLRLSFEDAAIRRALLRLSDKFLPEESQQDILERFADQALVQGMIYGPIEEIKRMASTDLFVTHLPELLRIGFHELLHPNGGITAIRAAAGAYGERYELLLLARFYEIALADGHSELIDQNAAKDIQGVGEATREKFGERFISAQTKIRTWLEEQPMSSPVPEASKSAPATETKTSTVSTVWTHYLPVAALVIVILIVLIVIIQAVIISMQSK